MRSDDFSPAHTIRLFCDYLLDYIDMCKLSLTCGEREFRIHMCEFICTYYVSRKRHIGMRGPFSYAPRPSGWTAKHENEWQDYSNYTYFSSDFWDRFWYNIPEAIWEYKTPGWRGAISSVILHYIAVQPHKIDSTLEMTNTSVTVMEMGNDTRGYVGDEDIY